MRKQTAVDWQGNPITWETHERYDCVVRYWQTPADLGPLVERDGVLMAPVMQDQHTWKRGTGETVETVATGRWAMAL